MGWDDRDDAREGFWDGRTLGDEPAVCQRPSLFVKWVEEMS